MILEIEGESFRLKKNSAQKELNKGGEEANQEGFPKFWIFAPVVHRLAVPPLGIPSTKISDSSPRSIVFSLFSNRKPLRPALASFALAPSGADDARLQMGHSGRGG